MNLNVGQITLIDLIGQMERKEVIINRNYQRGAGVWPDYARTYFIDTILEGYPFPKIYLYQVFSEKTKRPIKEIVDGQQRITTIIDFMADRFKLTSSSKKHAGLKFSELDPDIQNKFISYQIDLSTILSASRPELLEMFRRINAYTAPLSSAEKRHAKYQGKFKWFVAEQADEHSKSLESLEILTAKNLARMGDCEFIADLILVLEKGVITKGAVAFEDLYKSFDKEFPQSEHYSIILKDFFDFLNIDLIQLHDTFMMKSYAVHSLFSAYAQCKYGFPNGVQLTETEPNINFDLDLDYIIRTLTDVAYAHEIQDTAGEYADYVNSCLSATTNINQRKKRLKFLVKVLTKQF